MTRTGCMILPSLTGLWDKLFSYPALKGWAIVECPCGTCSGAEAPTHACCTPDASRDLNFMSKNNGEYFGPPGEHFSRGGGKSLVRHYPYFQLQDWRRLTRSRPLARSRCDLCSDRAEYIPFAASQAAQVFVTTYK